MQQDQSWKRLHPGLFQNAGSDQPPREEERRRDMLFAEMLSAQSPSALPGRRSPFKTISPSSLFPSTENRSSPTPTLPQLSRSPSPIVPQRQQQQRVLPLRRTDLMAPLHSSLPSSSSLPTHTAATMSSLSASPSSAHSYKQTVASAPALLPALQPNMSGRQPRSLSAQSSVQHRSHSPDPRHVSSSPVPYRHLSAATSPLSPGCNDSRVLQADAWSQPISGHLDPSMPIRLVHSSLVDNLGMQSVADLRTLADASRRTQNREQQNDLMLRLALRYDQQKQYSHAVKCYRKFIEYCEESGWLGNDALAIAYNHMGVDLLLMGGEHVHEAIRLHQKHASIADSLGKFVALANIGLGLEMLGDQAGAAASFREALPLCKEIYGNDAEAFIYAHLGAVTPAAPYHALPSHTKLQTSTSTLTSPSAVNKPPRIPSPQQSLPVAASPPPVHFTITGEERRESIQSSASQDSLSANKNLVEFLGVMQQLESQVACERKSVPTSPIESRTPEQRPLQNAEAEAYLLRQRELSMLQSDVQGEAQACTQLASLAEREQQHATAARYLEEALTLAQQASDDRLAGALRVRLGIARGNAAMELLRQRTGAS